MKDADYLQAIIENEINIEFCDKIVWLRPRSDGLPFLSEDIGVKLKDVCNDKTKAVKRGIEQVMLRKQF